MTALLFALAAILLWSSLALAGAGLTRIPPFLLLAAAFGVSGLIGLLRPRGWRIPLVTLGVGTAGIFGYHFLYFLAFARSPAIEVNLLNYLWPLLIVVLSPLVLPGYQLRPRHVLGALLGLCGAGLIAGAGKLNLDAQYLPGYLMAVGAALTWALYSLLTKRLPPFPTDSVGVFCLLSGLLSLGFYFASGGTFAMVQKLGWQEWGLLALLGLGPMGAAFFFWDAALKRGDPRVIGSLAYLTPLLSTLNLVVFAGKRLNPLSFAAMLLIVLGAVVGSFESRKR
jgi:drug/metabolite transporter (DMT)-like permease